MADFLCVDCRSDVTPEDVTAAVVLLGRFDGWCKTCLAAYLTEHIGHNDEQVEVWIDQPTGRVDETPVGDDDGRAAIWSHHGTVYVAAPTSGRAYKAEQRAKRAANKRMVVRKGNAAAINLQVPWENL